MGRFIDGRWVTNTGNDGTPGRMAGAGIQHGPFSRARLDVLHDIAKTFVERESPARGEPTAPSDLAGRGVDRDIADRGRSFARYAVENFAGNHEAAQAFAGELAHQRAAMEQLLRDGAEVEGTRFNPHDPEIGVLAGEELRDETAAESHANELAGLQAAWNQRFEAFVAERYGVTRENAASAEFETLVAQLGPEAAMQTIVEEFNEEIGDGFEYEPGGDGGDYSDYGGDAGDGDAGGEGGEEG